MLAQLEERGFVENLGKAVGNLAARANDGSELARAGDRSRRRRSRGHSTLEGRFSPRTPAMEH
eukprot:2863904-Pleurochrysis_carterae.AAC.1